MSHDKHPATLNQSVQLTPSIPPKHKTEHWAVRRFLFVGACVLVGLGFLWRARWPIYPSFRFVDFEYGQTLHYADLIKSGAHIYRDFFTQYGPLPVLSYAAFASVWTNSAEAYTFFSSSLDLIAFCLAALLLRRWLSSPVALAWASLALAGRLLRGPVPNLCPSFETIFVLAAALTWRSPTSRSHSRSLALGLWLGLMQTVKFGGAFPAGFIILVADWVQLVFEGRPIVWKRWITQLTSIAGGFLLVESLIAAWLFGELSAAQARDVLWPAYMLTNYNSYVQADLAFSSWHGANFFGNSQLPVLVSVGAAATLASYLAWPPGRMSSAVLVDLHLAGPEADILRPSTWGRSNPALSVATTQALYSRCEPPVLITSAVWLLKIKAH